MLLNINHQHIQEAKENGEHPVAVAVRYWEAEDDDGNLVSCRQASPEGIWLSHDMGSYPVAPEVSDWMRQWAAGDEVQPINLRFSIGEPGGALVKVEA